MRQEINTLKDGLSGEIGIAAIPTALGMVASLTTPFRARHPNVRFRIVSCTSIAVLGLLENLEVDAGLTICRTSRSARFARSRFTTKTTSC